MANPISALSELLESCRSGDFYQDYDESCRLIREAEVAMATLARLVDGGVDAAIEHGPEYVTCSLCGTVHTGSHHCG